MTAQLVEIDGPRLYRAARHQTPWGAEVNFASRERPNVGRLLYVDAGEGVSLMSPAEGGATYFLLSGLARLEYRTDSDRMWVAFHAGDVVRLPPGSPHRLIAAEDVTLIECAVMEPRGA